MRLNAYSEGLQEIRRRARMCGAFVKEYLYLQLLLLLYSVRPMKKICEIGGISTYCSHLDKRGDGCEAEYRTGR